MTNNTNLEAEQTVLGALLIDPLVADMTTLQPKHFSFARHRKIMEAVISVRENDIVVDLQSVTVELANRKIIEQIGNVSYLSELAGAIPSTANFGFYEKAVYEAYRARMSSKLATEYINNPSDDNLGQLIANLSKVQETGLQENDKTVRDHLIEIAEDIVSGSTDELGFEVGFEDLDRMTGGLQRSDLIIIAARPSVGKTAFALNLASGHCSNNGTSHVFSLEMGAKQLLQRFISMEGNIDHQKLRHKKLGLKDYHNAMSAIGIIAEWNLQIHDDTYDLDSIKRRVRQAVREEPNERHLVVIDYLQLIQSNQRRENRTIEVGQMTRELKQLARELNIPIVLLSQLSRAVEQRQDKRPLMSDLRESGSIEQDADIVGFLYREDYYDSQAEQQDIIEIILAKQRNGPIGSVQMAFLKEFGKFVDLKYEREHVQ